MLKIHAQKLGDTLNLRLRGQMVIGGTATLRAFVDSRSDVNAVVLDLSRVSRIDAAGLGVMLELREQLQSRGIEFRLTNVTSLVRQVLEIARLDSVFVSAGTEVPPEASRGQPSAETETAPRARPAG